MENNLMELEDQIVKMLKTVYDPEIPVNVYDLGLIYGVDIDEEKKALITMTLTAPACPAADFIVEDVKMKVESIQEIKSVDVEIVFSPEWHYGLMSEEAKLELGFL
jgi:FeS assembly SUF system protein